jgi:hypothetical protein
MYFALGASPALLSMLLQKYFSLSSFSYLSICNPTHKTNTGTANRWETTKSNASGAIKLSSQSESGSSQSIQFDCIYYTLPRLLQGHGRCGFFRVMAVQWIDSLAMTAAPHPRFLGKATYWAPMEMLLGCSLSRRL